MKKILHIIINILLAYTIYAFDAGDEIVNDDPVIYSVSTDLSRDNYNRTGSMFGGTRLYIKVVGTD